jgi:IS4 transposase
MRGRISTYEWKIGTGWIRSSTQSSGMPFRTGFGARSSVDDIGSALVGLYEVDPQLDVIMESDIRRAAPDLDYLTPTETKQLMDQLRQHSLRLLFIEQDNCYQLGRVHI